MYNATKDDLTAILLSGLDGAPLTRRERAISMVSVKHIDCASRARKRQTCASITVFVIILSYLW